MRDTGEIVRRLEEILNNNYLPTLREIIFQEVAAGIEKLYQAKQTRIEMITDYLNTLYAAQGAGHDSHTEITEALEQLRKEIGF